MTEQTPTFVVTLLNHDNSLYMTATLPHIFYVLPQLVIHNDQYFLRTTQDNEKENIVYKMVSGVYKFD